MKLAEALLEKKATGARITELNRRYSEAALIEEGDVSEENESAEELLASLQGAFQRWEQLTVAINVSNNQIQVGEVTMMQALARRDALKSQIAHFGNIKEAIRGRNQSRRMYGENAPKMLLAPNVSVQYFTTLVDSLSQELRLLDLSIQAANWANDLVEYDPSLWA